MTIITQLIKDYLVPGSVHFLFFGLLLGLILLHLHEAAWRWAKRWLVALLVFYYFLSTPLVAGILAAGLYHGYSPITQAKQVEGATAVVVLSGGSANYSARGYNVDVPSGPSAFRAMEAAHIHSLLNNPWIILSGGIGDTRYQSTPEVKAMTNVLVEIGIPTDRIIMEPKSKNTYEQGINVTKLLEQYGIRQLVLVTSPTHMRRAQAVFAAHGFNTIAAISPLRSEGMTERTYSLLPSTRNLFASQSAMREYLAITYYWARGWLG